MVLRKHLIFRLVLILSVEEGETIAAGTILAKISKQTTKSSDITGGLPRVTELFEARSPQEPAIVSEIEGKVKIWSTKKRFKRNYCYCTRWF